MANQGTAPALLFEGISKRFGHLRALEGLSLSVAPGEILGLVGPNGAGKTTAIQIAVGFLLPSAGTGTLMGRPFSDASARRLLGFVPDSPVFFSGTARDAMRFAARLTDVRPQPSEIERILDRVGLEQRDRDVRRFSRGMQQRLALALALVNRPRVLILDEPASALDPRGVLEIRQLMQELRRDGAAILLSSHQLGEVAQVSDRVAFLNEGRLVHEGRLEALLGASGEMRLELEGLVADSAFAARWGAPVAPGVWQVPAARARDFLEDAWSRGAALVSAVPRRADLTELFLEWSAPPDSEAARP